MFLKSISLVAVLSSVALSSFASTKFLNLVEVDLYSYRDQEILGKSVEEIKKMNAQTLEELNAFFIDTKNQSKGTLLNSISQEQADQLIATFESNPITAYSNYAKYNRPPQERTEIGYCFGRAAYMDIALRKLGVNEQAIKKIWVVGPMDTGTVQWGFHVATLVKSNAGPWLAVDNYPGYRALTAEQWVERMLQEGRRNNVPQDQLRFYVTEPQKFSVSLGKYSRGQMGLDMQSGQDWYRGFFKDLMAWMNQCSGENESGTMNTGLNCLGISSFINQNKSVGKMKSF